MSSASPAPEDRPAAWQGRSRGTPLGHRIFIFLIRRVGLWAAYTLLVPVSLYFVIAAREPGRAWLRYDGRVRPTDHSPRWWVLFRAYHTFGKLIIDKAAVMAGLKDRFRTEHQAADTLQRILDAGRGGLLISAHVGNWQMASYMLKRYRGQVSVVMLDAEEQAIKQAHEEATQDKRYEVIALKDDMSHLFRIRGALAEVGRRGLLEREADVFLVEAVQGVTDTQHLFSLDFNIGSLARCTAHRLVQKHARVWQRRTLAFRARCENKRGDVRRLAGADRAHFGANQLHRVIDGKAR